MYETFAHTADLGLRVEANSLEELLAEAGRGLCSMLVANLQAVEPVMTIQIEITATELEYLLFDWLNELLHHFEAGSLLLSQFDIEVSNNGEEKTLTATCRGEKVNPPRHDLTHEVKAITYHGLKVEPKQEGWFAELIVDI